MTEIEMLTEIKECISTEYNDFKKNILHNAPIEEVFDRAQEIIVKTAIADEILSNFDNTFRLSKTISDANDKKILINTLYVITQIKSSENKNFNLLEDIYTRFVEDYDAVFDPDLISDCFVDNYFDPDYVSEDIDFMEPELDRMEIDEGLL